MQTFLPYADFEQSARVLDRQRLGKQRVEVLQILKALHTGGAWSNHPATKMWKGYELALISYGCKICEEWVQRGYKDTCWGKIFEYRNKFPHSSHGKPAWIGNEAFHNSHKSNLMRKDIFFYNQYRWNVPLNLEYLWPKGDR